MRAQALANRAKIDDSKANAIVPDAAAAAKEARTKAAQERMAALKKKMEQKKSDKWNTNEDVDVEPI
jgi:hypothetical protein